MIYTYKLARTPLYTYLNAAKNHGISRKWHGSNEARRPRARGMRDPYQPGQRPGSGRFQGLRPLKGRDHTPRTRSPLQIPRLSTPPVYPGRRGGLAGPVPGARRKRTPRPVRFFNVLLLRHFAPPLLRARRDQGSEITSQAGLKLTGRSCSPVLRKRCSLRRTHTGRTPHRRCSRCRDQ